MDKPQIKIHFVPRNSKSTASSRLRVYAAAEKLNTMGIDCRVYPPPTLYTKKDISIKRIKEFFKNIFFLYRIGRKKEILFGQKIHSQPDFAYLIIFFKKLFGFKFVFDFDDAIFDYPSARIPKLLKKADVVLTGGHYLLDKALQYNNNVKYIATSYDPAVYDKSRYKIKKNPDKIHIGWIGRGTTHKDNLRLLVNPLKKLAEKYPLKFTCIGVIGVREINEMFEQIPNLETFFIDNIDWADEACAAEHIFQFDIGVMPLLDSIRSRGTCAGKAIQYMFCRTAAIAGPYGENCFLIQDGVNGFLAADENQWLEKLEQLISDKKLRDKLGARGYKTVLEKYNLNITAKNIYEILTTDKNFL